MTSFQKHYEIIKKFIILKFEEKLQCDPFFLVCPAGMSNAVGSNLSSGSVSLLGDVIISGGDLPLAMVLSTRPSLTMCSWHELH